MNALPPKKTPAGGGETTRRRLWRWRRRRWRRGTNRRRTGAHQAEAVARELPQGQVDHDQLPPQRGRQGDLSFERKLDGRRVRGKCVKPAKGQRPNCTRYSRLGSVMTLPGQGRLQQPRLPRAAVALEGARGGPLPADAGGHGCLRQAVGRRAGRLQADGEHIGRPGAGRPRDRARLALGCAARTRCPTAGTSTPRCSRASASGCSRTPGSTRATPGSWPSRAPTSRCGRATCRSWSCAIARASCARS